MDTRPPVNAPEPSDDQMPDRTPILEAIAQLPETEGFPLLVPFLFQAVAAHVKNDGFRAETTAALERLDLALKGYLGIAPAPPVVP